MSSSVDIARVVGAQNRKDKPIAPELRRTFEWGKR